MRDHRNAAILGLSVTTAFLLGALLGQGPGAALAQPGPGSSTYGGGSATANNRMIAATGSVGSGMSVLWLVDTKTDRLLVYGTSNLGKNIELRAARNIKWDLKLDALNDESQYAPEDLEELWNKKFGVPAKKEDAPPGKGGEKNKGK